MSKPSPPLAALAVIALVEGLVLVAYGVYALVEGLRLGATGPDQVSNVPAIALEVLLFALFGVGLIWLARGWWGARRWARAPFVLAQIIALLLGVPLAQADGTERIVGVAMSLIAVLGIVLVFTPQALHGLDSE